MLRVNHEGSTDIRMVHHVTNIRYKESVGISMASKYLVGVLAGSCEQCNKLIGSIRGREFLD
jgi:hypothetical protein